MPTLRRRQYLGEPPADVFPFFQAAGNLEAITPRWLGFRIASAPGRPLRTGDRISYRLRLFGVPLRWDTVIARFDQDAGFADAQVRGPYRSWIHTHIFEATADDAGTIMEDRVDYELPFRGLGRIAAPIVRLQLWAIFRYRSKRIRGLWPD